MSETTPNPDEQAIRPGAHGAAVPLDAAIQYRRVLGKDQQKDEVVLEKAPTDPRRAAIRAAIDEAIAQLPPRRPSADRSYMDRVLDHQRDRYKR